MNLFSSNVLIVISGFGDTISSLIIDFPSNKTLKIGCLMSLVISKSLEMVLLNEYKS